jgi:hypothetical protein
MSLPPDKLHRALTEMRSRTSALATNLSHAPRPRSDYDLVFGYLDSMQTYLEAKDYTRAYTALCLATGLLVDGTFVKLEDCSWIDMPDP